MRNQQSVPVHHGLILRIIHVFVRLTVAFVCGLLLAFLVTHVDMLPAPFARFINNALLALSLLPLFPLYLGVFVPFTIQRRNKHLIPLSIATGWFVLAGIYTYYFPLASQNDALERGRCTVPTGYCHGAFREPLLNLSLFYGMVVVLLTVGITSFILKRNLKQREGS